MLPQERLQKYNKNKNINLDKSFNDQYIQDDDDNENEADTTFANRTYSNPKIFENN